MQLKRLRGADSITAPDVLAWLDIHGVRDDERRADVFRVVVDAEERHRTAIEELASSGD